jgi:hypothetical protein
LPDVNVLGSRESILFFFFAVLSMALMGLFFFMPLFAAFQAHVCSRKIVTPEGKVIKSFDDIEDGKCYICCGAEPLKTDLRNRFYILSLLPLSLTHSLSLSLSLSLSMICLRE